MSYPLLHEFTYQCHFFLFGIVIISLITSSIAQEKQVESVEHFCPYFKNRAPLPRPDLQNCTWYRSKACCLSKELDIILDRIPPPTGANEKCLSFLNRLMCYVCAPDQNLFYKDERLTVCLEFCDKLYDACGDAMLKGSKVKDAYDSGTEFCLSRKFGVKIKLSNRCFMPDNMDVESSAFLVQVDVWFVGLLTLVAAIVHR